MKKFFKKLKSNVKGFTLAELLIVVAIISILALIAVPIFGSKLERAREETDIANIRLAKAAAVAMYLCDEDPDGNHLSETGTKFYFDAISGCLTSDRPEDTYGEGTSADGGCESYAMVVNPDSPSDQLYYESATDTQGCVLEVTVNSSGTIKLEWDNGE